MRITVLILALVTCFFLFLQAAIVGSFSPEGSDEAGAGAFGVLMSLLMLVSAAVVIPLPRLAAVLLLVVGATGFIGAANSDFVDLYYWGGWALLLAVFAYFGYRGKRKSQAKEAERDAQLTASLAAQQQTAAQLTFMQQQLAYQQQLAEYQKLHPEYVPPPAQTWPTNP